MLEPIQKVRPHVPPQHEVYVAAKKEAERLMNQPLSNSFVADYFEDYQSLSYYLFERLVIEVARVLHENDYVIMPIESRDLQLKMKLIGISYKKLPSKE